MLASVLTKLSEMVPTNETFFACASILQIFSKLYGLVDILQIFSKLYGLVDVPIAITKICGLRISYVDAKAFGRAANNSCQ